MCDALLSLVVWAHFKTSCDQLVKSKQKFWQKLQSQIWRILLTVSYNLILFGDRRTQPKHERVKYKHVLPFKLSHSTLWWQRVKLSDRLCGIKRSYRLFLDYENIFWQCTSVVVFPSSWLKINEDLIWPMKKAKAWTVRLKPTITF